jgi:Ca2+/Na+ antiporter
VHLVFDIFQGIGVASAVGIRPFTPALVTGALAAGDTEIDFNGTHYSFLEHVPFLLAMLVLAIVLLVLERRLAPEQLERGPGAIALGVFALVIGALLFGGALADDNYMSWPGLIGGALCAAVAIAATRPLLARVRSRLDKSTAATIPFYAEASAIVLAALSVVAPPVGIIALLLLLWLLIAGRRRGDQKYAGLRILR